MDDKSLFGQTLEILVWIEFLPMVDNINLNFNGKIINEELIENHFNHSIEDIYGRKFKITFKFPGRS
jgi:hypothetical protein